MLNAKRKIIILLIIILFSSIGIIYVYFQETTIEQALESSILERHWNEIDHENLIILSVGYLDNQEAVEYQLIVGLIEPQEEQNPYVTTEAVEMNGIDLAVIEKATPFMVYLERVPRHGWEVMIEIIDYYQYGVSMELPENDVFKHAIVFGLEYEGLVFDHLPEELVALFITDDVLRIKDGIYMMDIQIIREQGLTIFWIEMEKEDLVFFERNPMIFMDLFSPQLYEGN